MLSHDRHFIFYVLRLASKKYVKTASIYWTILIFVAEFTALTNFAGITSLVYVGGVVLFASVGNEPTLTWYLFSANQNQMQTSHVPAYLHFSNNKKYLCALCILLYMTS